MILIFQSVGELHDREDADAEGLPAAGQDHRASEVGRADQDHRQRRRHVHDEGQRVAGVDKRPEDGSCFQRHCTRTQVSNLHCLTVTHRYLGVIE